MMVMKMMTTVMTMNVEGANVFYHLPTNVQCIMDCGGIAATPHFLTKMRPKGPKKFFGRPGPPLISGSG